MLKKLFALLSCGFLMLNADGKIDLKNVRNDLLCQTFDDSHYEQWLAQFPPFENDQAHTTFFYFHELDAPAIDFTGVC